MIIFNENDSFSDSFPVNSAQTSSYLKLRSLAKIYLRKQWKEELRPNAFTAVYYVQTGSASAIVDETFLGVPENHFLLVKPGHSISFSIDPTPRTFLYAMQLEIRDVASFDALPKPVLIGKNAHIDDLFYHLYRSTKMKMNLPTTSDALVGLILEQCLGAQRSGESGADLYRKFCEYVENNIGGDLSADRISEALCYNKDYICRVVKQFSGKTLKEYISVEKLYVAKFMLSGKDAPLSEIADTLGFASTELFCKFFKYYTNTSPMEYRRENSAG